MLLVLIRLWGEGETLRDPQHWERENALRGARHWERGGNMPLALGGLRCYVTAPVTSERRAVSRR